MANKQHALEFTIKVKPLSVNKAFQGRRFKTREYKDYETLCLYSLPSGVTIPDDKIQIHYTFGMSNKLSDVDNPAKLFQDILQKKYKFNDSRIYRIIIDKVIVPKGGEFITFQIEPLKVMEKELSK